jgi:hypothetical protein
MEEEKVRSAARVDVAHLRTLASPPGPLSGDGHDDYLGEPGEPAAMADKRRWIRSPTSG